MEWARQLAREEWQVHATCRVPDQAEELRSLAAHAPRVTVHPLDVTSPQSICAVAQQLDGEPIDVLINNAGVYFEKYAEPRLGSLLYEDWVQTFEVNTLGAIRLTEAFVEHVARSERRLVIAITSHMGSISDIESPGSYYYRSSKAALNAAMKGVALALRPRGVGVLLLHPGWVRTRMGGPNAPILPATSVRGMRSLVEHFALSDSGSFLRYDGTVMPW